MPYLPYLPYFLAVFSRWVVADIDTAVVVPFAVLKGDAVLLKLRPVLFHHLFHDVGMDFDSRVAFELLPFPLEEKPKHILEIDKQLLDHTFQETYYINRKKQTELGLTKCYFFDSAANYLNFLLLNLIQLNPNICLCQNCGELFVAKTKKKTLYCDRIQPDSNKTCSEIGPKNRAELQSTLFGFEDYGKAVERNYQRAKRTEEYYVKDKQLE